MAHPLLARFEPPPAAMSDMASLRSMRSQYMASMSAAKASRASEQQVQATDDSDTYDYESEEYGFESSSGTTITFGSVSATPTDDAASQTDNTISSASSTPTPGSTLSTSTSINTAGAAESNAATDSPYRHPSNLPDFVQRGGPSGPPAGKIAAAVIIPIVILSALAFGLFYLRRRSRRKPRQDLQNPYLSHHQMKDRPPSSPTGGAGVAMLKGPRSNPPAPVPAPVLISSATNNAYYTGLSLPSSPTSSTPRGPSADSARSAGAPASTLYEPPPPAYAKHPPPGSSYTLPDLHFAADPFIDPPSHTGDSPVSPVSPALSNPHAAALAALSGRDTAFTAHSLSPALGEVSRPAVSRAGTVRSVTSDMYSDTASLHSARRGVRVGSGEGWLGERDPFGDPEEGGREGRR